jgi:hypothetical protein
VLIGYYLSSGSPKVWEKSLFLSSLEKNSLVPMR